VAEPYQEGKRWAMRTRVGGHVIFVSKQKTKTAARAEMARRTAEIAGEGRPMGFGPHKTTLGQALQDYCMERFPFMKGAKQEANRANKYLRALGLRTLVVQAAAQTDMPVQSTSPDDEEEAPEEFVYFDVTLAAPENERVVPAGLGNHRRRLEKATSRSDPVRKRLAAMPVAEVMTYDLQKLIVTRRRDRRMPATIGLERALLRAFFNHARYGWHWSAPAQNPATHLKMPKVDNARERVMSVDEQARLDDVMKGCRNALVQPVITLLTETAMRASEPLEGALWSDVDWDLKILTLRDAKTGKREVPLSPKAIGALERLRELAGCPEPGERLVCITYEAVKKAWSVACGKAEVEDLHIHDLRHTAATRLALKTGNVYLVKALTGLKTWSMVHRYSNVKASDVVAAMHAETPAEAVPAVGAQPTQAMVNDLTDGGARSNVVTLDSWRRRSA
jgi:integrase